MAVKDLKVTITKKAWFKPLFLAISCFAFIGIINKDKAAHILVKYGFKFDLK